MSAATINFPSEDQSKALKSFSNGYVPAIILYLFESQILTVLSPPHVANICLSGWTANPHSSPS